MANDNTLANSFTQFQACGDFNALNFLIKNTILNMVNVAIPVRVDSVERSGESAGAGYLSATPLIQQRDASGDALQNVSIPKLRFFRYQHGVASIICDPKPGDVGLAVFAHQDVSGLDGGNEPKPPLSFRVFDVSDGFYFGGFWGKTPTTFIKIEDAGTVEITAPESVTVNTSSAVVNCDLANVSANSKVDIATQTVNVNASTGMNFDTPTLTVTGQIVGSGGLAISGGSGASVTGSLTTTGDVTAGGISLQSHTHGGAEPGNGRTGTP